jgi:hypothetical protein
MLTCLRWPLLCLGLYATLTPAIAQLAGRGKLLRTPETPFVPMDPARRNYIGWEKFNPFTLAPHEKLWWESFSWGNDLPTMLNRGVTHQSVTKTPQAYSRSLPPEKRAVMMYANAMVGTRFLDSWHHVYDGLADAFTEETDNLLGKVSGFMGGQSEYLGQPGTRTPIQLIYLDFENRALYDGNLYARNVINNGNYAIRGAKGHYSNEQYLSEYRSRFPYDTRGNDALLSLPVRNVVDNGVYSPGGQYGHLSEGEFLGRYANAWGEKVCLMVRQLKNHVLMPGAQIGYNDVSAGEPDLYVNVPERANATTAYRWPWGYNCGDAKEVGDMLDFADLSFYPRVNTWRNGRFYYYGEPDFEQAVQANIAEDRGFLTSFVTQFENNDRIRRNAGFISLWYPFYDVYPGPDHFKYPLRNDIAEAMAIFGMYFSTTFIVWSPHGYSTPENIPAGGGVFRACEYFISGLKRMAWHNDMRTGNFQRVIPEISLDGGQTWGRYNTYQSRQANRPTVRALVKGNEILVLGYNDTSNDATDLSVMVRYNSWQDTIVLRGRNDPNRRVYVGRAVMN